MPGKTKRSEKQEKQGFEDLSSYSPVEKKKRRKGRRGRMALQCVAAFLCVVMIVFGAGLIYISTDVIAELTTTTITKDPAALGFHQDAVVDDSIKNIARLLYSQPRVAASRGCFLGLVLQGSVVLSLGGLRCLGRDAV